MPSLHIRLLGGFRIAADEHNLDGFHQPRLQALLAYLLLHRGTPVARQVIAFTFWPDSSEKQARTNLRKLLHTLRGALPTPEAYLTLTTESVTWRADADVRLDVAQVEAAWAAADAAGDPNVAAQARREAVAAYTGDLLPGFYDEWVLVERERLHNAHTATLAALVTQTAADGDHHTAVEYAQQLLQQDPLHESGYRLLMQLHLDRDDRAAALHVYHGCASILREELGVDPSPATDALYQAALQGTTDDPAPPPLTGATPLVGRGDAWQRLQHAWQTAEKGHPHLVLIQGEAGIGKTRLAEELVDRVRHQGRIALHTRAFEARGGGAYAPLTALLNTTAVRRELPKLDPAWRSELARLLPDLLSADPTLLQPAPIREDWQRRRLHEALARACLNASSPLLIHIDDLQWADAETLEWLHFLLHFDPAARLLVVGTVRDDEVDATHPLPRLKRDLQHSGQCSLIDLTPLPAEEVAVLATAVTGDAWSSAATASLFSLTEGNPLFVVETLRAGELTATDASHTRATPGLPPKVYAVLTQRLAQLSPTARQLAHVAAVIGTGFDFGLLAAATPDLPDIGRVAGLDELWRRRILREEGTDGYDFSHDRLRDVAYGEIGPGARRLLHDQVASALIARAGPDGDAYSGQIAVHAEQAGRRDLAAEHYRRAGDHAARSFAHDDALHQYTRSLACLDDHAWEAAVAVRLEMEQVYARTTDPEPRLANLQMLQALLDRFPVGPESAARVAIGWSFYYSHVGMLDQSLASAQRAVALTNATMLPLLKTEADLALGDSQWSMGRVAEAQTTLEQAVQTAQAYGDEGLEARALEALVACGMFSGMPATDIERYLRRCRAIHERHGNLYGQLRIDNKLGFVACAQGQGTYRAIIQRFKNAVEVAHRIAAAQWEGILCCNLGWAYTLDGDYAAAGDWLRRALDLTHMSQDAQRNALAHGYLGELAFNWADTHTAIDYGVTALEKLERTGSQHWRARFLPSLGLFCWEAGQLDRARSMLVEAIDLARALADRRFEATARIRLAHVQLAAGELNDAEANYTTAWTLRRDLKMFNRGMEALAGLADIAWRKGDCAQTCAHLDTLVAHITQHSLDYTEETFQMLATTHRLLVELDDPRAITVYGLAHAHLQRRAATLDAPARDRFWRTSHHAPFRNPLP